MGTLVPKEPPADIFCSPEMEALDSEIDALGIDIERRDKVRRIVYKSHAYGYAEGAADWW